MFTMCNTALNTLRHHNCTMALSSTKMARSSWATSTTKQTEFINYSERDLINNGSIFYSHIFQQLTCSVECLPFEKLLLNVRLCV